MYERICNNQKQKKVKVSDKFKSQLTELIAEGHLTDALQNLGNKIRPDTKTKDEITILLSRLNILKRDERLGVESKENLNLIRNKLTLSVLQFIRTLKDEDLIPLEEKFIERITNITSENESKSTTNEYFEIFNDNAVWNRLQKVGKWTIKNEVIEGEGMFNYLLSKKSYGLSNFTIFSKIEFEFRSEHLTPGSGIVLGWAKQDNKTRYYNILFTGKEILLEAIGLHGDGDFFGFHLSQKQPCSIYSGTIIDLRISIQNEMILVVLNNSKIYQFEKPNNMVGKVGIRPWRTKVKVSHFEVRVN